MGKEEGNTAECETNGRKRNEKSFMLNLFFFASVLASSYHVSM